MRKKMVSAAALTGIALIVVSTVNLFLIRADMTNHMYLKPVSGSMEPIFGIGDLIKVKLGLNASEISAAPRTGDIIVFRKPTNPEEFTVSQAIDKVYREGQWFFRTKGDNKFAPDPWEIPESYLIGRVVEVNPPIWTWNNIFWAFIAIVGVIMIAIPLSIELVRKRRK